LHDSLFLYLALSDSVIPFNITIENIPPMPDSVLFATGNKSKLAQIRFVADYYRIPITIENGKERYGKQVSYSENASRKGILGSAVAYAEPHGQNEMRYSNYVEGRIAFEERAGDFPGWIAPTAEDPFGGGFNAIFIPDGEMRTLAEISPEEALPWSYREKPFLEILKFLPNS